MDFPWRWSFKDYPKEKNGLKVYSCFACGGGSTMGYELAGYDVIGANDIDEKMAFIYRKNHHPRHYHLMDIRKMLSTDLPDEMFDLDILDGSPPCSTFSIAGKREKEWGKERKFREGQAEQILDDLFFRFLELAERLKPKIIVAENVAGMLVGKAKNYSNNIMKRMEEIGYDVQAFLLNSATMGVPQRRKRMFFIGKRKNLRFSPLLLMFDQKPISFHMFKSEIGKEPTEHSMKLLLHRKPNDRNMAEISERIIGKYSRFNAIIVHDQDIFPTIISGERCYRYSDGMECSDGDYINAGTFPQDFDFCGQKPKYVVGMSVPPVMMANVAEQIAIQLFRIGRKTEKVG